MDATSRQTRKYEKVVEAIRNAISKGDLAYGEPLPPERQMIEDLGVSRSSLREAFSVLELLGLIESIPGKGRFVRHPQVVSPETGMPQLEGSAVLELMEARGGDGLALVLEGSAGLGGVAGGGVVLVQRVDVDSGLSHDVSFACRGVPGARAPTGRPG